MRSTDRDYLPTNAAQGLTGIMSGALTGSIETKQDGDNSIEELFEQAWGYVEKELFEPANEAFTKALQRVPANSEAIYGQALYLRKTGKMDEARRKLEDLSAIDPGYTQFLVKEAKSYLPRQHLAETDYYKVIKPFVEVNGIVQDIRDDREFRVANGIVAEVREAFVHMIAFLREGRELTEIEPLLDVASGYWPDDAGIRSEYGWLYYFDEKYEQAIEKFDEVLRNNMHGDLKANKYKDLEGAIQGKAASLRLLRKFQKAYEFLEDPIQVLPDHYGIQSELAWLYFDQKQYGRALNIFERLFDRGATFALQWMISCLRSQRNYKKAKNLLRKAFDQLKVGDPLRIGIQNERGWFLSDKKQYEQALIAFDETLRADERNEFALQGKVASLRLLRRFQEADDLIRKAQEWHPTSTGILSERGWLLFDQQKYREADDSFVAAIRLAPNRIDLKFSRVETLSRMSRSFEAEKILLELKKQFPDDIEVMDGLGRFYIHQKDLRRAETEFQSILKKEPGNIFGLAGQGAVCVKQARYEEAISCFRKTIEVDEHNPVWYANLAWALIRQENRTKYRRGPRGALEPIKKRLGKQARDHTELSPLDEAERLCERALSIDPESAEVHGCLGTIAFKRGNLRYSEDYLKTSIAKDPQKGNYVGLGALYSQMGRYSEAENELKEALQHLDDPAAHIELGNLYLNTGRTKEAIEEFRQAMALEPNDDEPPRALAIALMRVNEINEAERVLRDALRSLDKAKKWRLHLTLSQLLAKNGDETEDSHYYNEAFKEAKHAIRLRRYNADPYFQVGYIKAKLKDYQGARKYFRLCLRQDPNHDEAESNLTHIRSLIREEKERSGSRILTGFCIGVFVAIQCFPLWYFFNQGKVTETILSVLLPILLGLVIVAFLLPVLYKLKLPGLEAELRERKETVSSGPKGEIVFSSSPPTISSGPH